jgi:hypothetical protein
MRDWGFNDENCEAWFERAFTVAMVLAAIVIMIRVSCIMSSSNFVFNLRTSDLLCDNHLQLLFVSVTTLVP